MSKHIDIGQQRGGSPIVFKSGNPISVICVASTFTSLSYVKNGGKVQITSVGVHGLTTSPAVGAKVYVLWSGGTGVNGLYKILSVDSTTAITIDLIYTAGLGTPSVAIANTMVEIYTFNLPILSVGSHTRLSLFASHTISANMKTYTCTINGVAVAAVGVSSGRDYIWLNETIYMAGNIKFNSGFIGYGGTSSSSFNTYTIDTTTNNTFTFSVRPAVANETTSITGLILEVFQ